jgi:ribosomal protein S18 acetylase RimI-like enzyme
MTDSVIVRPITPTDVEACARIMAENPLWQRYGVTLASARKRLSGAVAAEETIFVAERAGEVMGFVLCVERGAFARSGYIPLIGVHPDAAGQGVGRALMDRAEAFLSQISPDIFLLTSDFNQGAQRFYQRRGYRQVGALPDYVLPGVTELILWKRVGENADKGNTEGH